MSLSPNTTLSFRHLSADGDRKSDYGGLNYLTDIPCCIQQLSEAPEQAFENAAAYKYFQAMDFGRVLADVREGDRATDASGTVYIVKGVKSWNEPEIGGEMQVVLALPVKK